MVIAQTSLVKRHHHKDITFVRAILIYIAVSLFLFFEMAVQVSPSVMAQNLMHDLNVSSLSLGLISSVYFYTYTAMQIPSGLLFDRLSPGKVIFSAILVCTTGTFIFGYATNFYLACVARLLMGMGSAFAFVSVLVMAYKLFQSKWFSVLAGITQMLAAFGAMAGQMPISLLVIDIGWRNTMLVLGIIGTFLAITVFCLIGGKKHLVRKSIKVIEEEKDVYNIKRSLALVLSKQQTWYIAIYACLLWAPMSGFASLWGTSFLETFDGLSKNDSAFYCSMMWLGLACGSPVLGIFSTLMNNKVTALIISAAIGMIAFGCILELKMQGILLGLALFLSGAACSGQALSFSLVKDNNTRSTRGTAIAFNNMAVVISGAAFQPAIGWLLDRASPTLNKIDNFKFAISAILIAYIVGFLVAIIFVREPLKDGSKNKRYSREDLFEPDMGKILDKF